MVLWYNFVSKLDTGDDLLFLNHGYAPAQGDPQILDLEAGDEKDRYAIQLYHQLAEMTAWTGRDALEVSSGRGGGTAWVMHIFQPSSLAGLDIAKASTAFCRSRYSIRGMSFETGDAQAMPFGNESFDIVMNVESSLNYPKFDCFLQEVFRVLRPGGQFLICDYRRTGKMDRVPTQFKDTGFNMVRFDDISPQIIRGLELSEPRKLEVIEKYAPRLLRSGIRRFARVATEADSERDLFVSGKKKYFSALLQKPADVS